MKDKQISSVVGHESNDKGDPDGGEDAGADANDRKDKYPTPDHAVDKSEGGHMSTEFLSLSEGVSFLFLIENMFFPHNNRKEHN